VRAGDAQRTLKWAVNRFWGEVGCRQKGNDSTLRDLNRILDFFGDDIPIVDITDDRVAEGVLWRRSQKVHGREDAGEISPATVNRSFTKRLQAVFTRARLVWKCPLPNEPNWRQHFLKEPKERVRFVRSHEESLLDEAVRDDYKLVVEFARASGLRQSECLLLKAQVDLQGGLIQTVGKGDKPIDSHPITSEMRRILMEAMANPTDHVFTYVAQRDRGGIHARKCGDRVPITTSGLKTMWRRARRNKSGPSLPADFRFHDLRHDFATRLYRQTKDLQIVQKACNHADIKTTQRYAHILSEDVAAGMEKAARAFRKSHGKSHGTSRKRG